MWNSVNLKSNKSIIVVLVVLLLIATIMMPVQIRPAAYNQRDPLQQPQRQQKSSSSAINSKSGDSYAFLDDDWSKTSSSSSDSLQPVHNREPENHLISIYVIFHKMLDQRLFSELQLPDAMPDAETGPDHDKIKTGSILDVVLGGNKGVTFFATNQDVPKTYNSSNPLFQHRIVEEWDTPGYKQVTGDQYRSAFNEFGAMASIYYSGYTFKSWSPQNRPQSLEFFTSRHARKSVQLRRGADDAFIGILQYDMKLNDKVMKRLRNQIKKTRKLDVVSSSGNGIVDGVGGAPYRARSRWSVNGNQANGGSNNNNIAPHSSSDANSNKYRVAHQARAVRLSKMHRGDGLDSSVAEVTVPQKSKCCVFYSISYPMQSLLDPDDVFTKKLFELYNLHFFKKYNFDDLSKFAILDAFVIPFSEFNRFIPFAENLMRNGVRNGALTNKEARATSLKQLEQALALFLGLLGKEGYQYVMMPLRHEPRNRD